MAPRRVAPAADRLTELLEDPLGLIPLPTVVVGGDGAILHANDLVSELLGWESDAPARETDLGGVRRLVSA